MLNTYLFNTTLYNIGYQESLYFHYLIDGSYRTRSLPNNRLMIIGQDVDGYPVTGTAEDTTEQGLVGERLDIRHTPLANTATLAGNVASAVVSKARLEGAAGFVTLPPNCGQQLYDVVSITDEMADQAAISRRVMGLRLRYNSREQHFVQQLLLGAV